ncbi:MAG: type VI secretion system tube protein Hcp [Cellulomonas sp.]|nr:type VI secretion system tube protein Hcp [Cellulomonas sp.]MCR6646892.1 type VI secretion system tube protein Hcp [Cellulomonas sp.]
MTTYLRLESIDGDGSTRGHEKWIEVQSVSWALAVPSVTGSGRSIGRVAPEPLRLTTVPGRHSPGVLLALVQGTRLPTARVERTRGGEREVVAERWELTNARVVEHTLGVADDAGLESLALAYGRVTYSVIPQTASGKAGKAVSVTWDVAGTLA